jgi:diguanylate cyclase (GGDEF)-like protein
MKVVGVVLLCVLVPLSSAGFYLWTRNDALLGDKVKANLANQLFRKASDVDDWMAQRIKDANHWGASFVVYEGLEALSRSNADAERIHTELRQYLQSVLDLGRYHEYESLFLLDRAGHIVASTREEEVDGWLQAALARSVSSAGEVSPLLWGQDRRHPTMVVVTPVKGRTDNGVGHFVERLDLRELHSRLNTPVDAETSLNEPDFRTLAADFGDPAGNSGPTFWLLDETGQIVIAGAGTATGPKIFPGRLLLPDVKIGPITTGSLLEHERPFLYGLRRLDRSGAGIVVAMLREEAAYKPREEAASLLGKIGLVTIGLSLLVSYVAAQQMLHPIRRLSEGARRVSAGDLDVFLPVGGRDEIGDLTRAFNEMARRVRDGRQSLEEARDELARSNEGLIAANRTLETLAITDGLTGLYNHRHFQDTLEKELRRSERELRSLSLLLLDLDHFKQYNDRFGHTEGDAALRRVSGLVMKSIRSTDVAFRYGGEELAVLLPSCTKAQAADVAEKIRTSVAQSAHRPGRFGGRLTVSIGVATFPEDGRVARGLVDFADAALYTAKARGRDAVSLTGTGSANNSAG